MTIVIQLRTYKNQNYAHTNSFNRNSTVKFKIHLKGTIVFLYYFRLGLCPATKEGYKK